MQQGCYCRYTIFIYTFLPITLHCTNVKYFQGFIRRNILLKAVYYFCALYRFSVLCDDVPKCRLSYDSLGIFSLVNPEPVFVNVYGAQESIPRNRFRQPMKPGGPVRKIGFRTGPPGWESIPGLLKRSTNTGSEHKARILLEVSLSPSPWCTYAVVQ